MSWWRDGKHCDQVVGSRCVDLAFEKAAHGHLCHSLDPRLLVPLDLADADIVLAVTGGGKSGHGDGDGPGGEGTERLEVTWRYMAERLLCAFS